MGALKSSVRRHLMQGANKPATPELSPHLPSLRPSSDFQYRLILNYLNAFDAEITDKRLLVRSAYFEAIMEVLDEVVRATVAIHGNAKQESLQKIIRLYCRDPLAGQGVESEWNSYHARASCGRPRPIGHDLK